MKVTRSRKILKLVSSISLVLMIVVMASMAACAKPKPAPTITIVFNGQEPPNARLATDFFEVWFDEIEERTGGRVKVEAHWSAELVGLLDVYNAVVAGTVDIAQVFPMMLTGKFPMDEIMTLPSMDVKCDRRGRVHWELYKKFPEMQEAWSDVKLLWVGYGKMSGIGTTKKPIRKLEDNQGLKMASGGRLMGFRAEALGWTNVALPVEDIFISLEKGVIDGTPVSLFTLWSMRYGDVLHYITLVEEGVASFACPMNLDKWNSLPADVQKIMEDMTEEMVDFNDTVQQQIDRECLEAARSEFDIEFIELPPEEVARWVEVDRPIMENFVAELEAKDLPGRELMEEYLRLEKEYAAEE